MTAGRSERGGLFGKKHAPKRILCHLKAKKKQAYGAAKNHEKVKIVESGIDEVVDYGHINAMTSAERRREKLKNAVLYFVKNDKTVGLTKLMKLLFYLDFRLYREHGESLTGQTYSAWPFGPVPKDVWLELREKEDRQIGLSSVVRVMPANKDPRDEATGVKLVVAPGAKFSDKYFNGREFKELATISEMFKGLPASLVVKASHAHNDPWDVTIKTKGERAVIDYDLVLTDCDDEHRAYVHEVRDDAALLESILG